MPRPKSFTPEQKAKIISAVPSPNKILAAVPACIYFTHPGHDKWSDNRLQGALTFTHDISEDVFFFRLVDSFGERGVIWSHELGVQFEYHEDQPLFHSFPGDDRMIGIAFSEETDATLFYKKVASRKLNKVTNASSKPEKIKKGGKIDESVISGPQQGSFRHVAHLGYDEEKGFTSNNVDEFWLSLVKDLQKQGFAADVIEQNRDFIQDFVNNEQLGAVAEKETDVALKRKLPPPPAPRRGAHAASDSVASTNGDSVRLPLQAPRSIPPAPPCRLVTPPDPPILRPVPVQPEKVVDVAPKKKLPPPPTPRRGAHVTPDSVAQWKLGTPTFAGTSWATTSVHSSCPSLGLVPPRNPPIPPSASVRSNILPSPKMSESSNSEMLERSYYVSPQQTKEAIRTSIHNAIRSLPLVLINVLSGRLCSKLEQATAFESMPAFKGLIASMTTQIDYTRIEKEVAEFYRYVTFSHTWERNEPQYEKVIGIAVHDLEAFPTHKKLQMFCGLVRKLGFTWAWSDTCCIDKKDPSILQEALVSMFKWYEGSAMTIIFLCDVDRLAVLGALMMSIWNSRGWTLQEYHASKVVQIYTKDWTPYLGLTLYNHKESPEIISEMEKATGISKQALMALHPGLNDIWEKLHLASKRQTTRVEDTAYSLLGIFSMTLPVTYGEGDKALGRLLSQLLMSSGDTSILAWTGKSGSFNSCLPMNISVFSESLALYIPPPIPDAEMRTIIAELRASSLDLSLVASLQDRVRKLRTPTFAAQRMRLPCLTFKIRLVSRRWDGSEFVFEAKAGALGSVKIKTTQIFTPQDSLYLVHPSINFLLNRCTARTVESVANKNMISGLDEFVSFDSSPDLSSISQTDLLDNASLPPLSTPLSMDAQMRAYEFLARLKQPFGALLLASTGLNTEEYKRVVTESLITVEAKEISSATLNELIQGVRELDVL